MADPGPLASGARANAPDPLAARRAELQQWRRCCLSDHVWQARVMEGPEVEAAYPPRPLHAQLCRRYVVATTTQAGAWGDVSTLLPLALMERAAVAVYHLATQGSRTLAGRGGAAVDFGYWLGADPGAGVAEVHLLNLRQTHFQAFLPQHVPARDAPQGTPVEGERQEAGGEGDCMFYAFLAAQDAAARATDESTLAHPLPAAHDGVPSPRQRMLDLRTRLGAFIEQHWDDSVAVLGSSDYSNMTLGQVFMSFDMGLEDPLAVWGP